MPTERSTRAVVLSNGDTVLVHEYITLRERRQIQGVFMKTDVKQTQAAGSGDVMLEMSGLKGTAAFEAENETIKVMVQKVKRMDGTEVTNPHEIVDYILDLKDEDGRMVMNAIEEVTNPKKEETT